MTKAIATLIALVWCLLIATCSSVDAQGEQGWDGIIQGFGGIAQGQLQDSMAYAVDPLGDAIIDHFEGGGIGADYFGELALGIGENENAFVPSRVQMGGVPLSGEHELDLDSQDDNFGSAKAAFDGGRVFANRARRVLTNDAGEGDGFLAGMLETRGDLNNPSWIKTFPALQSLNQNQTHNLKFNMNLRIMGQMRAVEIDLTKHQTSITICRTIMTALMAVWGFCALVETMRQGVS